MDFDDDVIQKFAISGRCQIGRGHADFPFLDTVLGPVDLCYHLGEGCMESGRTDKQKKTIKTKKNQKKKK